MKRGILVVTLAMASLALAPRLAAANETGRTDSVKLFGKTYCFSWAPPGARCDVRLGYSPNVRHALGMTICTGAVSPSVDCDVELPAGTAHMTKVAHELRPAVVPLFGKSLCFGNVSATTHCDVRFGGALHAKSPTRTPVSAPM